VRRGDGTVGSRSLQLGGSAVARAGEDVVEKARRIVASHLEAAVEDIVVFDTGGLGVAGHPGGAIEWNEVARLASDPEHVTPGESPGLAAEHDFTQAASTFPFGAHVCVVEVDVETGATKVLRHIAVDDCGRVLNPLLVRGQVHGGIAQGIGQALLEHVRYDDDANPLSGTLVSYLIPTAGMLPGFELGELETPTPLNPLGAKGIGESGTIGATPAVQNAVVDAVSHLGVRHIDMPATAERVWRAIQAASTGARS
jgi:carbon-monoxide dehydrogenase large subunit